MRRSGFAIALLAASAGCKKSEPTTAPAEAPLSAAPVVAQPETPQDDAVAVFCEKLTELMLQRVPEGSADRDEAVASCIENGAQRRAREPEAFERDRACAAKAAALEEFFVCAMPRDPEVEARVRRACQHMVQLASAEPDFPEDALVEMEDIETCIESGLLEREADPAAFDASVACMLEARDLATLAACLGPTV